MNHRDRERRAYHRRKKVWRWAIMGGDGTYVRLDPHKGEHLHDFDVWEVKVIKKYPDGRESFEKIANLDHLPRVFS